MDQFNINNDFCEFYGILLGDGCISKYKKNNSIVYAIRVDGNSITDKIYYDYLKKLVYRVTKRNVSIKYRKHCNGIYIYFFYKDFANFLNENLDFPYGKKINIKINENIVKNKSLLKSTLKGLFDTDGSLYFTKNNSPIRNYPIIELSTHSSPLLYQLKDILSDLGFNVVLSYYKDSVKLHGKINLEKWMSLIGSNNDYKFNRYVNWKKKNEPKGI